MEQSLALSVGLPVALVIIMLGLGLSLRLDDFIRCFSRPGSLAVGLLCQVIVLPAICFALVSSIDAQPAIAVGMMLLAASPGGPTSALFAHLARGDAALSLTLAAVTSLLALLTLPVIANLSLLAFYGASSDVRLELHQVLQIFVIAIIPALAGAFIHNRHRRLAERMDRPVKAAATVFLATIVLVALIGQWELVILWAPTVGVLAVAFNVAGLLVGYFVPRLLGIGRSQAVAVSMSIGIRNAALAIAVAMSETFLAMPEMAIPAAAYGLFAYLVCGMAAWIFNLKLR